MRLIPTIVNAVLAYIAWIIATKVMGGPEWAGYLAFTIIYFNLALRDHIDYVRSRTV